MTLDEALERIRQLEAELGADQPVPACLGLATVPSRMLGVILRREIATRSAILLVAYGDRLSEPAGNSIDVLIKRIRERLKPYGITIQSHYGTGFSMSPGDKAKLRALIGQGRVAA